MGTTGSSDKVALNQALPDILSRVRKYATVPIAVGFGVATREHYNYVTAAGADGVVVGSRLVPVIKDSLREEIAKNVEVWCLELRWKGEPGRVRSTPAASGLSSPDTGTRNSDPSDPRTTSDSEVVLPARFGQFGGQYVPESIFDCLIELEEAHKSAIADPEFWKEFQSFYGYMNRPSKFYLAENLTHDAGGARIWLKREDL
jgi:tryptophan synthase